MDDTWKVILLKRVLPGLIAIGLGLGGLAYSHGGENQMAVFGRALLSFPFIIVGAIFLARPIAYFISAPFVSMLFPEDHGYTPPPIYRLPEMYVRQERYLDAVGEYQKILHHHPREIRAYLALLEVAFQYLQDVPLAEKTYKMGLKKLRAESDRTRLEETFHALQAGAPLASSAIQSYP